MENSMSEKIPLERFEWDETIKFTEDLKKNYRNVKTDYFSVVEVKYSEQLGLRHKELPFLAEKFENW